MVLNTVMVKLVIPSLIITKISTTLAMLRPQVDIIMDTDLVVMPMLNERPHIEAVIGWCRALYGDDKLWRKLRGTATAIEDRERIVERALPFDLRRRLGGARGRGLGVLREREQRGEQQRGRHARRIMPNARALPAGTSPRPRRSRRARRAFGADHATAHDGHGPGDTLHVQDGIRVKDQLTIKGDIRRMMWRRSTICAACPAMGVCRCGRWIRLSCSSPTLSC